jgi:hypothetical protein
MTEYYETPFSVKIFYDGNTDETTELSFSSGLSGKMWKEIEFAVNDIFEGYPTPELENELRVCITGTVHTDETRMDILAFPKHENDDMLIPTYIYRLDASLYMTPLEKIDRILFPKEIYGNMYLELY